MTIKPSPQIPQKSAPSKAPAKQAAPSDCGCPHAAPAPQESIQISGNFEPPKNDPPKDPQDPKKPPQDPPADPTKAKVSVYAQDPYVDGPMIMDVPKAEIGNNLQSDRAVIRDNREHAKPDAQGNYLLAEHGDGISQVNALVFTNETLNLFEEYRGSEIPWATRGSQLSVTPHKQEGRNAYYSRWGGGTNYFYSHSPGLDTVMKTANSTDVVSHETGHALLDGLRPGYFGTHDDETGAFHEAFGDCAAMLMGLKIAGNDDRVLEATGGSLREHNVISSLAEEFGAARAFDNSDPSDDHKIWLRTALNSFTYKDPKDIPPGRGDDDNLGREVHSFSRLFSAAFYDTIESVYMQSIYDDKQCPKEALKTAERVTGPLLTRAIEGGSTSRARFKEIALGMIAADKAQNDGKYSDGIKKVFLDRKIITAEDLAADEARRASVPSLQLPEGLSKANSVNFLEANAEALGIPADAQYVPDGVTKNGKGETFVSFRYSEEVPVTVAGLEDKVTDVQGGVNLVFDASGKLIDRVHDEINAETVEREMLGIANMQAKNAVIDKEQLQLFKSGGEEHLFKSQIDGNKIVRIPISGCDHGHEGHHH
ncbi:MAG: hypothetical protein KC800_24075 [Candidatus Eremiobacteraeota bacterium]|nr:hypothetical protein [Candidatus Eremiobacteraeota bacterium]